MSTRQTFAEATNTWVQTIAIIAAGVWAFYTFVYKEIWLPRSEIGHVSGKAELHLVAFKDVYRSVEASIYIKNNSRKAVKLLAGLVEAVGYRFEGNIRLGSLESVPWQALQGEPRTIITAYDTARITTVLMVSDPLRDAVLGAGEERMNTVIFHIDSRCCDYIDLYVHTPFVFNDLNLTNEWEVVGGYPVQRLYKVEKSSGRKLISDAKDHRWLDDQGSYDSLYLRHSLSLWPEWHQQRTEVSPPGTYPQNSFDSLARSGHSIVSEHGQGHPDGRP